MIMTHDLNRQCATINMEKYILECIEDFEEEAEEERLELVSTPATNFLFEKILVLSCLKEELDCFILRLRSFFVAKRARPSILLMISFLTTRVKCPDQDDWKKLMSLLGYLKRTAGLYAFHEDMRGQSGAVLLAGNCTVLFRSNKQKVNTSISTSTETELVAVDDALPTIQWTKKFMCEQGYDLETMIKEDN
jgi:hypothetical protein